MSPIFIKEHYSWKHPVENIRQFLSDCRDAVQRIQKGYCSRDLWDIDTWLIDVFTDMLSDYRKKNIGYPSRFERDFYDKHKDEIGCEWEYFMAFSSEPRPWDRYKEQCNRECDQRWKDITAEMERFFRESDEDMCSRRNPYGDEYRKAENKDKKEVWTKYLQEEDEIYEYRKQCRTMAFAMLNEYFDDLWI